MAERAEVDTLKGWPAPVLERPALVDSGGCTRPGALNSKTLKSQDRSVCVCESESAGWYDDRETESLLFTSHHLTSQRP
jgi:hypothetical protein